VGGSPAVPDTHFAADPPFYVYWLQPEFLLQVALADGDLIGRVVEVVEVGGGGATVVVGGVVVVGDSVVWTVETGSHP
jgi:hypothetical protein